MPAKDAARAAETHRTRRVEILGCLTTAFVGAYGYRSSTGPHPLALAEGDVVRLTSDTDLGLTVLEEYDLIELPGSGWEARTVSYFYEVAQAGQKLLAYHWHPTGVSRFTAPHLHVRGRVEVGGRALEKAHLPTGIVNLEDIIRLAINDFGAVPLREDWQSVLAA